jgi:hypothetical protein
MALRQLVAGSPMCTLCLLIAGQPAEVFSSDSSNSGDPSVFNRPQHPTQVILVGKTNIEAHACLYLFSYLNCNSCKDYGFLFYMEAHAFIVSLQLQFGSSGMLNDWEENLAVITSNRTKDDELVIIHLGDCLWKERSQV